MRRHLLMPLALVLATSAAALSPPCQALAHVTPPPTALGQYKLTLTYPRTCTRPILQVRIKTAGGGIIYPPIGYFRLSAGYPREISYYVWPGAHPQQKDTVTGLWIDLPISNKPGRWF